MQKCGPFLMSILFFAVFASGCRTANNTEADGEVKSAEQTTNMQDLRNGLYKVTCNFGRTEISTSKLINADKVCDRKSKNYITNATGQGAVFNVTCANGKTRVATMTQINSNTVCGASPYVCSCTLEDASSIIGYSRSASNVAVGADSQGDAISQMNNGLCFDAVSQLNPAFSRESSIVRNVSCQQKN